MEKKITKKEMFTNLYNLVDASKAENKLDLLNFIDHEIELLEKKSANRKSTKTQTENVGIKTEILKALEDSTGMTVSQIMPLVGEGAYTNQKISSLLRQLVESGEVVRYTEKRVAYFRLA